MTAFDDWPWQYSFAPFFTVQPNLKTRQIQLKAWGDLVLKYHRAVKKYVLDTIEASESPLFNNKTLKRSLSAEGILEVLDFLQSRGNAEPLDKSRTRWYIYWHTLDEWASILYEWVETTGHTGSVCTFYELASVSPVQEFTGIDSEVLKKVVGKLEQRHKAELMVLDDSYGVKFF